MGQLISSPSNNRNNIQLTNSLIRREFILSMDVERAFRCVDRGFYYTNDEKHIAYRDRAWQSNEIHLSAPCVYATVLECLKISPGQKFLNIGSGIGYLNTVVGFLLDTNGVNHGIEIHQSLVDLAYQKMEEFKLNSAAIDHYYFCEPVFIQGNACQLEELGFYDKVYCGASVPDTETGFMKSLIKVGGVLVMPLDGYLLKITRTDKQTWQSDKVLDVSFTDLVIPKLRSDELEFPSVEPLSLQEMCRSNIRSLLRTNLLKVHPKLEMCTKCCSKTNTSGLFNDQLARFVRLQYDVSNEGLNSIRNIVESFTGVDEALSETESTSDEELIDDEVDIDGERLENHDLESLHELATAAHVEEPAKRKSLEAGSSVQNKIETETNTENPKRMKMDSSIHEIEDLSSVSSPSDLWETISTDTSVPNDVARLDTTIEEEDDEENDDNDDDDDDDEIDDYRLEDRIHRIRMLNTIIEETTDSDDSNDSEAVREISKYQFISDRRENKLSVLLMAKIELLPLPKSLKIFLNYNRID